MRETWDLRLGVRSMHEFPLIFLQMGKKEKYYLRDISLEEGGPHTHTDGGKKEAIIFAPKRGEVATSHIKEREKKEEGN